MLRIRPILGSRRAPGVAPRTRGGRPPAPRAGRRRAPPPPPDALTDAHTCAHSTEQGQKPEAKREVMHENPESASRVPRHGADFRLHETTQVATGTRKIDPRSSGAFRDNLDLRISYSKNSEVNKIILGHSDSRLPMKKLHRTFRRIRTAF